MKKKNNGKWKQTGFVVVMLCIFVYTYTCVILLISFAHTHTHIHCLFCFVVLKWIYWKNARNCVYNTITIQSCKQKKKSITKMPFYAMIRDTWYCLCQVTFCDSADIDWQSNRMTESRRLNINGRMSWHVRERTKTQII